jgi:hypothetical protein
MHPACRLTIALGLSFASAGLAAGQQDLAPEGPANSTGQTQGPPAAKENIPAKKVPSKTSPSAPANSLAPPVVGKTSENATKKKMDHGSANATRKRRKLPAPSRDGAPRKIVVREGGASEPAAQIAPDITPAEAARQRQSVEQLLVSTDDQLKLLARRTLNAGQQETVGQIRNYMDGARSALKEGDVRRASTLAQKAHLLIEDLVRS